MHVLQGGAVHILCSQLVVDGDMEIVAVACVALRATVSKGIVSGDNSIQDSLEV